MNPQTKGNIKILFWNCRNINNKKPELLKTSPEYDIIICVETWLNPKLSFSIPGFQIIRKDRTNHRGGGIAILLKQHFNWTPISDINIDDKITETLTVKINTGTQQLTLCACYRPPSAEFRQDKWNHLLRNNRQDPFILAGDFNCHHEAWNCRISSIPGERLLQTIEENDCAIHNTDTTTYVGRFN
ncbi:RNA-directed DNA polymerase from mobile element jockey [Anthophora quadrimaculata]